MGCLRACCSPWAVAAVAVALGGWVALIRTPQPAPQDPAEAAATKPYHDVSEYKATQWWNEKATAPKTLAGKVALVTGGSSGIGKAVASDLYALDATVYLTSRSLRRATEAAEFIKTQHPESKGVVTPLQLDLACLSCVRAFTEGFLRKTETLHYLVENAGGFPFDMPLEVTSEGYEPIYVGNYLGHFLLTQLLLPTLTRSAPARITATSSIAHWCHDGNLSAILPNGDHARTSVVTRSFYARAHQYGATKLLQILMCFELQRVLAEQGVTGITVTPLAPGFVQSAIASANRGQDTSMPIQVTPDKGAMTTMHALLDPEMEGLTGYYLQPYYSPLHLGSAIGTAWLSMIIPFEMLQQTFSWAPHLWIPHPDAHRRDFGRKLWDESLKAVGLQA